MNPRSIFQPKTKIEATPHPKDENFTQKYQNPVTTFISIIKPSLILTKKKTATLTASKTSKKRNRPQKEKKYNKHQDNTNRIPI